VGQFTKQQSNVGFRCAKARPFFERTASQSTVGRIPSLAIVALRQAKFTALRRHADGMAAWRPACMGTGDGLRRGRWRPLEAILDGKHGMSELMELVVVAETALGRGVFARRRFSSGYVIGEIRGRVIDDPNYSSRYGMDLGGSLTLEPDPPFRFLNHSCEPNCELFQWSSGDDEEDEQDDWSRRMWLAATRRILAGEELTIDYGWPAEAAIPCRCNAPKCRGWVVDAAELPRVRRNPPSELAG
jgi:hypothetical protein